MGESMSDLFASMEEAAEERIAIQAADAIAIDFETERHKCEVSWIIRAFYPRGEAAAEYFKLVEIKRGKEMADKLRADCRVKWAERKASCET
jgi:hypothetical protein